MTSESTHPDLFRDVDPRVFTTDADHPERGRTFVYGDARWYERVTAGTGAVEFMPVAESEPQRREWLRESGLEVDELDTDYEFAVNVREEFLEQVPLYPEAAEDSDQPIDDDRPLPSPDELGDLSSSVDDSRPVPPRDQDIDTPAGR